MKNERAPIRGSLLVSTPSEVYHVRDPYFPLRFDLILSDNLALVRGLGTESMTDPVALLLAK